MAEGVGNAPISARADPVFKTGAASLYLLLNHSREIKRAGSFTLPARAISTKNKHLLVIYSIPTRGFTAAVSVFRGAPPPKPLECKSWSNHFGARCRPRWAEPSGGKPLLSCAVFGLWSL